ncbi:MAG: type IV pilus secretin PilQ [Candidatus Methylomirabilia bacterium]
MATGRLVSWASCGALAVWLLAGCGGSVAQAPKPAIAPVAKPAEITDVQVSGTGDAVQITVITSAKAAYSLVRQSTPPRLFLQLTATGLAGPGRTIPVNRGAVSVVKASASGANANVEVFLSAEARYDIGGRGDDIVLNVSPKAPAVAVAPEIVPPPPVITTIAVEELAPAAPAPEMAAPRAEAPSGPPTLTAIDVKKQVDGLVVTLQGNGPLKHEYFLVEGRSLVVDITGASNKVKPNKIKIGDSWVSQIRLGEHEQPKKYVRVVFDLKKVGEYSVNRLDDRIVVAFGAPALAATGAVGEEPAAPAAAAETSVSAPMRVVEPAPETVPAKTEAPAPVPVPVAASTSSPDPAPVRVATPDPAPAAVKAAAPLAPPAAAATAPAVQVFAASGFTGRRLSLDFKDAEVNDILRLISEVSGLNFVSGPEVKGTVSIKLADVPWDQALELILKTNVPQLAQVRESENIIRITTSDKIMDEEQRRRRVEEDRKKTIDAQKALEPIFSKTFAISYIESAKMNEFVGKLEKFKSAQGIIQFDERTKNIIVWDTADKLVELEQVILAWDAPTPAVLVEARIVEVSDNFGQSVGVQWNANKVMDAAHGNATQYAFPNSVNVGGQALSGATGSMPANYMVNLPSAVSTGGIGFSFGHIANTLSLDLRLSAGENMGKIKILSNPKVLVVQNQQAKITLGSELPVVKTDTEGSRTVEWKPVGITLDVKPQITNDKRVFMDIMIEKSSQGENVQTTEGTMFSVNTSKATTKVLIADGETTVIGGIFIEESSQNSDSIPGFSKIPVLGWLFKNRETKKNKRELMIFITPKIVVM